MSGVALLPLGEVVKPTRPRVKPSDHPELPFIGMEHVEAHSMRLLGTVPAATMKSSAVHFKAGDVLYGRLRPYLNKVYRPAFEGLCSAEFIVLPESQRVDGGYLQYFLNSSEFVRYASHVNTGDRPRVDFDQLAPYEMPLPDLAEQRRIVAEIEKQFSRLDEAVANLKRVKVNLKRYKAAVLKAAVEGRLAPTEAEVASGEAREFEDAEQLLRRILETRQQEWQRKGKYKKPADVTAGSRHSVPAGWTVATVDQLAQKVTDGTHHTPKYLPTGVPFISVKDVHDGAISFEEAKFISHDEHVELSKRCNPEPGDVLITKSGTIGRTATVETDREFSLFVSVALIKPVRPHVNPRYLQIALDAYIQSIDISQDVKGGLLKNLHLEDLRVVALPLPPTADQARIVTEVDRHWSVARALELEIEVAFARASSLRQTTMASAFSQRLRAGGHA